MTMKLTKLSVCLGVAGALLANAHTPAQWPPVPNPCTKPNDDCQWSYGSHWHVLCCRYNGQGTCVQIKWRNVICEEVETNGYGYTEDALPVNYTCSIDTCVP